MTVMFMTDAGRKTGDSKIDRLAMEYEDKYGQPLTEAQIERLDQLAGSSEYGNYAIDMSGFASDAPFGSPQRESELDAYTKNLQDERNAKRANFTLENLGISPDQNGSFTQPTAPQDSMQGGLGGLGSIFNIMKKQMPPPPTQNRGPILGRGPRSMQFIDENRNGIDDRNEENVTPLPSPFKKLPRGPFESDPMPSRPQMPDPDMLQKLQEALRQKQNREMPQRTPSPMRGDMRKKGLLGGLIEKLEMQAAQKAEQPQMPTRPQPRGRNRRFEVARPQSRGGMFGKIASSPTRGGSGGILPRAGGEPDLEQLRKQIRRGINVRGIGI